MHISGQIIQRAKRVPAYTRSVIFYSFAVFGCFGAGQFAGAQSLESALSELYSQNPEILSARADQNSRAETISQARSAIRPQITANFEVIRNTTKSIVPLRQEVILLSKRASLDVSQTIFDGFESKARISEAEQLTSAGMARLHSTEQSIIYDAIIAYNSVYFNTEIVNIRQQNIKALNRELKFAQARFDAGYLTRTDIEQTKARLTSAKADLSRSQATLAASRANYQSIFGRQPGKLTLSELPKVIPNTLGEALGIAKRNSPLINEAQANSRAASEGLRAAKADLLPDVNLIGGYSISQSQFIEGDENKGYFLGVKLTVPLYFGGQKRSKIRQARFEERSRNYLLTNTYRTVIRQTTEAWYFYKSAIDVIVLSENQKIASDRAMVGVKKEAIAGTRTTLDILNAELELLSANLALVNAQRDFRAFAYNLILQMGILNSETLNFSTQPKTSLPQTKIK